MILIYTVIIFIFIQENFNLLSFPNKMYLFHFCNKYNMVVDVEHQLNKINH